MHFKVEGLKCVDNGSIWNNGELCENQVGSSHRAEGVDYSLESIHNIREALPELWEAVENSCVRYSGKPAIDVRA